MTTKQKFITLDPKALNRTTIIRIVPGSKTITRGNSIIKHVVGITKKYQQESREPTEDIQEKISEHADDNDISCRSNDFEPYKEFNPDESERFEESLSLSLSSKKPKLTILRRCAVENESIKINPAEVDPLENTVPSQIHGDGCCCACRDKLDIILRQQQEILDFLKGRDNEHPYDLLPAMPFNDINDFLDFDESLSSNEKVESQFKQKIKKYLVSTDQKSMSNIMSSIMTNELAKKISWIGIKSTVAFGTTSMVGIIIDVIQSHHKIDMDTIKSRLAEWLRRCGDRIGNEMRKNLKRARISN
ncbi:uncharacterized protein LOC106653331 [Trichogramma pretiosum]|uniref:uncharacterized protein LOC106653331 n=1 Tax=Trichogramma pretiosum TaxID=7493 RepID=UPI0006C9474F|nr:uncharacterized protein LOC106653331 [Trichogramma pretiosum]